MLDGLLWFTISAGRIGTIETFSRFPEPRFELRSWIYDPSHAKKDARGSARWVLRQTSRLTHSDSRSSDSRGLLSPFTHVTKTCQVDVEVLEV